MKKLILAIVCTCISLLGFSQVDVQISKPFRVVDAKTKLYFNGENSILSVKIDDGTITLQVFDKEKMAEKHRKEYEDMPKKSVIEDVINFNGRILLMYSLWDKEKETEQLYCREIDPEKGEFIDKGELLLKNKGKISGILVGNGMFNYEVVDKFHFQFSRDRSNMLIQFVVKPEDRKDAIKQSVGLFVFNSKLEQVYGKIIKMPYIVKKMDIIDYSIDSESNAYVLTRVFNDDSRDKRKKNGDVNYHVELMKIDNASSNAEIFPVSLNGKFINDIWLYETPKKDMICAGYYYNDGKEYRESDVSNGIFTFKFDSKGEISDVSTYEFPLELINQYVNERTQKKNAKKDEQNQSEFKYLELRKLITQEDGSFVIVGEQFHLEDHGYVDSRGSYHSRIYYYYDNMLISKIDNTGKLAWINKLPKRQEGTNSKGGLSFSYMNSGKDHYLVYLDNIKNKDLPINKQPEVIKDQQVGWLSAYKIDDATGEVRKYFMFDIDDFKGMSMYQFTTKRILQTSRDEFMIEFYKKKKEDVYVKVKLP